MSHVDDREQVQDGIVLELARDDVQRKKFLKMAGKGIGSAAAASGLAAFIAACGSSSKTTSNSGSGSGSSGTSGAASTTTAAAASGASVPASFGAGDLGIVNYALTLEYLESQFYAKVIAANLFSGATGATVKTFGAEEAQHVAALEAVAKKLGTPAPEPKGKFPITSASAVATLAATVENLGAAAYLGQAGYIKSPEILAAALSIHTVEARHAATLNYVLKMSTTPDGAFAKPATAATVLAAVKPFIA